MIVYWNFMRSFCSGSTFPPSQGVNCSYHWENFSLSLLASGWAGFSCCVFQTCEPCLILVTVLFMCFSGQEVLLTEHALQRNQGKN